ncbi:MAG TPA: ABC transporter substrate-binding protein, partial [Methanomassiliicoccales archaeon]|nr:ABC transporter substrate-binding protein [Methanomassiliicoccales archaeon]
MEGEGSKPLPEEGASKGSSIKLIAAVIVVILIVAAIGGALLLMGGKKANAAPTAAFTADSSEVAVGGAVTFDGSASNDTDGKIVSYQWDFGDGNGYVSSTATVVHSYYLAGLFIAQLTVVDDGNAVGVSDVSRVSVTRGDITPSNASAPRAIVTTSADAADNVVDLGAVVTFAGNLSFDYTWDAATNAFIPNTSAIAAYDWLISPSTVKHGVSNTSAFAVAGVYCIQLTVTDPDGNIDMVGVSIFVKAGGGTAPTGTVYTHATIGEPQSLDPAWDYESAGGQILQQVYETLVFYNGTSAIELKPMLCTAVPTVQNGLLSADGLNYTFNIRPNVQFHDGNTVTADDVVYSLQRLLIMNDAEGPAWMVGQVTIPNYQPAKPVSTAAINAAIVKTGPMQVEIKLLFAYPAFLKILAYTACSVVEKAYVEANGGTQSLTRNEWMNRHEMGTGPYILKDWSPNNRILLQRFDNYWRGPAELQYVIIKKVQDLGTREMLLFSGQADSIYVPIMFKD